MALENRGKRNTASKGELTKVNLEGCKQCGNVYVSAYNATKLGVETGWYFLGRLQQEKPGDGGLDVVLRVRGKRWGATLGNRLCPDCKIKAE